MSLILAIVAGVIISFTGSPIIVNAPEAIAETTEEVIERLETPLNSLKQPVLPEGGTYCYCVKTARLFNENVPKLNAIDFKGNTSLPAPNDLLLLKYSSVFHVAYIERMDNDSFWIKEGNFSRCRLTSRKIRYGNEHITGFYKTKKEESLSTISSTK